jgi:hypothetical protein
MFLGSESHNASGNRVAAKRLGRENKVTGDFG